MSDSRGDEADGSTGGTENQQRLKVEDALNYLDQVKYKFGNQPQVYNDFLDIMKEFKSQSIDTPGVIQRVSHLFRGHPELIVGFNTFLPPGYKIEIQANDSVSLSVLGQGGGYVVTTVQTGPIHGTGSSGGHSNLPPTPSIQTHTIPGGSVRPPSSVNTNSTGRMTPPGSGLSSNNSTSFNCTPSSAFTHSYTSPFVQSNFNSPYVQSAFPTLQSQPVEFNHAINYVNKIKNRFQNQPDKYKQFLEILHTYQKEQKVIKEGQLPSAKHLTEHEVYSQVAKLFENQEDLLQEFGNFLPDATNQQNTTVIDQAKRNAKLGRESHGGTGKAAAGTKRPATQVTPAQERRKQKQITVPHIHKEVSLAEAGKFGTLNEYAFFDKVRMALKNPESYINFLRCLILYNDEVISKSELLLLTNPFLQKTPDLHAYFKDFVGIKYTDPANFEQAIAKQSQRPELTEEQQVEIDYTTCKRLGASYCAMPKNNLPPKCSGRAKLTFSKEVLNDVWVSFPAWSEDTAFSSSRKTQFEECIFKVEDERFELDVVIETNHTVIRSLETVMKLMARMSAEELADFQLNECLGGTSPTIHQRAIRRIYGDKAADVIDGLMKNPNVAVPIVLRRLKSKDDEWREAQKAFNKTWREQTEKFYLKSLDLQGISFKQSDIRALRSKSLLNDIETLYDERQEQLAANQTANNCSGPHMILMYRDRVILDDACLLLLHHVRRQSSIGKDDKRKIKQILKHFMADLFHHTRMDLSDDEDEASPEENEDRKTPTDGVLANGSRKRNGKKPTNAPAAKTAKKDDLDEAPKTPTGNIKSTTTAAAAATVGENDPESTDPGEPQPSQQSSTAAVWSELTKQKKLSTAAETQESRRTIAKRELKLLLSDVKSHELTLSDVGRTSLRDKATREYLSEMSKDDSHLNSTTTAGPSAKRRSSRRGSQPGPNDQPGEGSQGNRQIAIPNPDDDEEYALFFANSTWYVFLRLHQILCERLSKVYERAAILLMDESKEEYRKSAAYNLKVRPRNDIEVEDYYTTFLEMVRNLLDGNMEASAYEDTLREMFGIHAYIAYTMDKVIINAVRQLQGLMSDTISQRCLDVFHQASRKGGSGGFLATMAQRASSETWYQKQAEKLCSDDSCVKTLVYKKHCRMTMELMEIEQAEENNIDLKAKYTAYVTKFLKPDHTISEGVKNALGANPVLLPRNVRKWKKKSLLEWITDNKNKDKETAKLVVSEAKGDTPLSPPQTSNKEGEDEKDAEPMDVSTLAPAEGPTETKARPHSRPSIDPTQPHATYNPESTGTVCTTFSPKREEVVEKMEVDKQLEDQSHLIIKSVEKSQPPRSDEFMLQENLLCQFNLGSYRMVYLANSEDCIYLKGAMQRAKKTHKKLSLKWSDGFRKFHNTWLEYHVSPDMRSDFQESLMSHKDVSLSQVPVTNFDSPPYRTYHKYLSSPLLPKLEPEILPSTEETTETSETNTTTTTASDTEAPVAIPESPKPEPSDPQPPVSPLSTTETTSASSPTVSSSTSANTAAQ